MMRGTNFSQFKKMKEDAQSATMVHKDGHTLVIAKASLSHLHRKQLEALSLHHYARGGKVEKVPHYDEGGEVESLIQDNASSVNDPRNDVPAMRDSTLVAPTTTDQASAQSVQTPVMGPQDNPEARALASAPQEKAPVSSQPTQQTAQIFGPMTSGLEQQQRAARDKAKAEEDLGKSQSKAYQEHINSMQEMPSVEAVQQRFAEKGQQLTKAIEDGQIDPEHYWKNHSWIQSAVGMIIGGGAAGGGNPNPAYEIIKQGIDRDIAAQQHNLESKGNLWKMNHQSMQDAVAANLAAKDQAYIMAQQKVLKAGAEARGPLARAESERVAGLLQNDINMQKQIYGLHEGLSNRAGTGTEAEHDQYLMTARRLNPELAKDAESKTAPSIGVSKIPLTEAHRDALISMKDMQDNIDKAIALQSKYGKGGAWTPQDLAEAKQIQNSLTINLGHLFDIKRLSHIELENFSKQVGNIGGTNFGGTLAGLKSLKEGANINQRNLYNQLGITPFKDPITSAAAPAVQTHPKPGSIDLNQQMRPVFKNGQQIGSVPVKQ